MESFLFSYLVIWKPLGYFIFFLTMIFEGEISLFTAFFLAEEGYLSPFWLLSIALPGVLLGDFLWYKSGVWLNHSHPWIIRIAEKISKPFDKYLLKQVTDKPFRTMFISKFLYGAHHAILLRLGTLKLGNKKMLQACFISNIVWVFIVSSFGYLSGIYFFSVKRYFRFVEIALVIGLVSFLLLERLAAYLSQKRG